MLQRNVIILVSLAIINKIFSVKGSEVTEAFIQHGVVPDVLHTPPKNFLKVTYDEFIDVFLGDQLTSNQAKYEPLIKWRSAIGAYYTLVMIDPDVPSRYEPKMRSFNHWTVGNIPGNKVRNGEVLVEYVGSAPALNTGLHRYIFLLYRQFGRVHFREPYISKDNAEGRTNFNVTEFSLKYGLGEPIAGNFYLAQWDEYVPL